MPKPQQPELRRSGKGSTDKDGTEIRAGDHPTGDEEALGPVPEENRPGHHPDPDEEQDKPASPPS